MDEEFGGIIDDVQTALRWKPILPLLQNLESQKDTVKRLEAIRDVAHFAIKTAFKVDPYSRRGFLILALLCDLAKTDGRVRGVIEDLCK